MSTDKNYFQRRAMVSTSINEATSAIREKAITAANASKETAYGDTFRISSTKASRTLREKSLAVTRIMQEAADTFVSEIVRGAVPFDLSHISQQELVEQIRAVKDTYGEIINEAAIATPVPTPSGFDIQVPDHVSNFISIGAQDAQSNMIADRLARNVLTIQGLSYIKDKTPISFAYSNVDTYSSVGGEAEAVSKNPNSACLRRLTAVCSSEVRRRVGGALKEDADKREIPDSLLLEGKTGVAYDKAKRNLERNRKPSLLEEVFKTTKVLQESTGASEEDYLNETVFVTAILETYNALNCLTKNMDQVSEILYKKRKAFIK